MNKYSIAEILHCAADKHLAAKKSEYWSYGGRKEKFSCCAMHEAVIDLNRNFNAYEMTDIVNRIGEGLEAMGCPINSVDAFDDHGEFVAENQQARYAWLKFAAIIAEEQGV